MKQYILMSDVLGSRRQNAAQLILAFRQCTDYINDLFQDQIISPLTITLGDEFQGLVSGLDASVDIILTLERYLIDNKLPIKLRYVLYYGEIETPVNTKIAYGMLGKGLSEARDLMNNLKGESGRFIIDTGEQPKNSILNNAFRILQQITDRWRPDKDYTIVSAFLKYKNYKSVSQELNRDRSLIWKREKTLHISSYFSVVEIIKVTSMQ